MVFRGGGVIGIGIGMRRTQDRTGRKGRMKGKKEGGRGGGRGYDNDKLQYLRYYSG